MPDNIVKSSVGCKVTHEGRQYGVVVSVPGDVREQPDMLAACKEALAEKMARDLGVPASMQDADWRARFTWVVLPITQQDWDEHVRLLADEDADA